MIMVSACLAGVACRYDGGDQLIRKIQQLTEREEAVTVCPELLGGLTTPREPAEIVGGNGKDVLQGKAKVIDSTGKDVTEKYVEGAYKTLELVKSLNVDCIVLKENSPSCGSGFIYDGQFSGQKIVGEGVTTALLKQHGYNIISEQKFMEW
ncbi:DUF523 domain-containing protein [Longirhabdus pacifica]|uniref:DUF523 domain-containing protein n=1 Tax=Longirhabdus pacifica TaxID=2305227 RepID=UPI0010090285|nr:DUF523 domain-containing protein [Longirhabdus pacifica]